MATNNAFRLTWCLSQVRALHIPCLSVCPVPCAVPGELGGAVLGVPAEGLALRTWSIMLCNET